MREARAFQSTQFNLDLTVPKYDRTRVTSPEGELSTLAPRRARRGEFYVARLRPDSGPPGPRGLGL